MQKRSSAKRVVGRPFRRGADPRRHALTREERQRGYRAAKAKADAASPELSAWLWRRVRHHYRHRDD
jgi:hypothetical protein